MFERWKTRRRIKAFLARDPEMVNAIELGRHQFLANNPDYLGPPETEGVPTGWINPFTPRGQYHGQEGSGRWDWGDINRSFTIEEGTDGGSIIVYDMKAHPGSRNEPYVDKLRKRFSHA